MSEPNLDSNDIVQEIPTFLSQQLGNNLYIVQHPVRPHNNLTLESMLLVKHDLTGFYKIRIRHSTLNKFKMKWCRDQIEGSLDRQTLQSTIVPQQAN
ncbi:63_t:CDS:2 [Entrophospora sp. SA101]|nr:15593_t:CDS:2 [Entrophospora sp. SA101]CAJ0637715.1 2836_t:CDS:2 [Entrophospora sp. SA101]CAJ0751410.1 18789_t:CDS:2 [Entrophospora sp. SA101]CAJ0754456.1 63_t:CDS:2 [Entrophospora sp. SA101]CAJ0832864.1 20726_t:CDS:2 [Entrophospora sp. SA101]